MGHTLDDIILLGNKCWKRFSDTTILAIGWCLLPAAAMILDNFGRAMVSHFFWARIMPFVPLCNSNLSCARLFLNFVSEICGARCFFKDSHLVLQIIFLGVQPPKIILKIPDLIRFDTC